MRAAVITALAFLATCCAGIAGYNRQAEALALACARASERTDQAIAECYDRYGLEIPEGI